MMKSEFIKYMNTRNYVTALEICKAILAAEPNDAVMKQYAELLPQKIMQEEEESSEEESVSEEEGSEDEYTGSSDESVNSDDVSTRCSSNR